MTTVPLSVCYGALNLLVLADTSYFVPYVCDRAIAIGGVSTRARKAPYCRLLFPVVAWQRNGHTVLCGLSHLLFPFLGSPSTGALHLLYFLSFYNHPDSLVLMPLVSSQVPSFVPQEKKSARCCRFESLSDSSFIAQNLAFYRPQNARTNISLVNKRIT